MVTHQILKYSQIFSKILFPTARIRFNSGAYTYPTVSSTIRIHVPTIHIAYAHCVRIHYTRVRSLSCSIYMCVHVL